VFHPARLEYPPSPPGNDPIPPELESTPRKWLEGAQYDAAVGVSPGLDGPASGVRCGLEGRIAPAGSPGLGGRSPPGDAPGALRRPFPPPSDGLRDRANGRGLGGANPPGLGSSPVLLLPPNPAPPPPPE